MPSSQFTYDTRLNRFSTANDLVQALGAYNPTNNNNISKAELTLAVTNGQSANTLVATTFEQLNDYRESRRQIAFRIYGPAATIVNPACMDMRIEAIAEYLKSEFGTGSGAYKAVFKITRRINPNYKKKDPNAPAGAGISQMEKTFTGLAGMADEVIAIINSLGSYTPPDPNLSVANMTLLNTDLKTVNSNIVLALKAYGDANRARKKLFSYKGNPPGIDQRIAAVKNYLASFPGGKKSNEYIEFSQAIQGT